MPELTEGDPDKPNSRKLLYRQYLLKFCKLKIHLYLGCILIMTTSSITTASLSCSEENSSDCLHDSVNSSQKKQTGNMQSTNLGSPSKTDDWSPILIKIAKDRDRVAFGKLFDHFAPKIKSYGMMLRSQHTSPQMAEE